MLSKKIVSSVLALTLVFAPYQASADTPESTVKSSVSVDSNVDEKEVQNAVEKLKKLDKKELKKIKEELKKVDKKELKKLKKELKEITTNCENITKTNIALIGQTESLKVKLLDFNVSYKVSVFFALLAYLSKSLGDLLPSKMELVKYFTDVVSYIFLGFAFGFALSA